ncbi:GlxA family transcriptional regulator [Polycyclovorans algicola]|uniref:GlxA family transcriptional regulator n=1 Tax=Polycyclovorans algicola TaxID=616992 RepID=UPI0005BE37A7|nr:GlxA family transcriptional regulator [Polycyclovorans algicola]
MSPTPPRTIGFLIHAEFVLLDLSGALEAFHIANRVQPGSYSLRLLSLTPGLVTSSAGVAMHSEAIGPEPLDTLFVIGGERSVYDTPAEQLRFVRHAATDTRRMASVCVGAFILAAAGLLDGRRATTHWRYAADLQARYPRVRVNGDRIFTRDGAIWTSAGITAGIDLALALIEDDLGKDIANAVARLLVVYHRRAGGQMQHSALLQLAPDADRIHKVLTFAREHLAQPLPVEKLADVANLSIRQFGRAFSQATGTTPAKLVERLRVEAARPRIQEGREPLEVIARSVGFTDADRMRLSFRRVFGQVPQTLRRDVREETLRGGLRSASEI